MINASMSNMMAMEGIHDNIRSAWVRTAIALGWKGIADMKGRVHRLTGTLSRSIHVSVREEGHGDDLDNAKGGDIKETISPNWDEGSYDVLAGSWLPYAGPEAHRGGSHDFFTPAIEVIKRSVQSTYKQALEDEF
ncbi:hypothetical protein LCGC14_0662780 [marine sediment metagenome]|uniref:Uncharacterized protein n=1 Tax=marine sediment metagenome TaxID=412755 RepID=A0A0F9U1C6_9ZZZZ